MCKYFEYDCYSQFSNCQYLKFSSFILLYKLNEKNPSNIQGVIVTGVEDNSPAEEAGLQEGDIITRVGRKKIYSTKDFLSEMSKFGDESKVLFLVKRGSSSRFITITR